MSDRFPPLRPPVPANKRGHSGRTLPLPAAADLALLAAFVISVAIALV